MKFIISESKLMGVLHEVLKKEFDGFDDMWADWANYNCGMGECCDPYAIGFHLPKSEYYEVFFKLVDSSKYDDDGDYPEELRGELPEPCYQSPDIRDPRFDTLIIPEETVERIDNYLSSPEYWAKEFLLLINKLYGLNIKDILVF